MTSKAISEIPEHLKAYTTEQDPSLYTAIDHAGWRFIMRISADYFATRAHPIYLEGLKATGISLDRIPLVSEMDEALQKVGWRAATVSGFIPPAAFLEFMEKGILPIACEMRKVENLNYTPAPDIVHEAAGHAPILADQEYADYVKAYGSIATKAIYSKKDLMLYEAIRKLSDIKEKPNSSEEEIAEAQKGFEKAYGELDYVSEATQLARMSWWTIEYGLIGDLNKPLIYGAGLLSSLGESYHVFDDDVKKVPLSQDCIHQAYDITKPQPQLFVSPDIKSMKKVLNDYAETMACTRGGSYALGKAKHAETTTTTVFDTGLQVTGIVKNFSCNENEEPTFLNLRGPLQLSVGDQELQNWKCQDLPKKVMAPVGVPEFFEVDGTRENEWESFDFCAKVGSTLRARYKSGIEVNGKITGCYREGKKNYFISVDSMTFGCPYENTDYNVKDSLIFFGKRVVSVFGGAADRVAFINATEDKVYVSNTHVENYDRGHYQDLIDAYQDVRDMRSNDKINLKRMEEIVEVLKLKYDTDWLLRWELLELCAVHDLETKWEDELRQKLEALKTETPHNKELIHRGLECVAKKRKAKSSVA